MSSVVGARTLCWMLDVGTTAWHREGCWLLGVSNVMGEFCFGFPTLNLLTHRTHFKILLSYNGGRPRATRSRVEHALLPSHLHHCCGPPPGFASLLPRGAPASLPSTGGRRVRTTSAACRGCGRAGDVTRAEGIPTLNGRRYAQRGHGAQHSRPLTDAARTTSR